MFGFEKIGQAVSEKKIFEYHGHIRNIYSPGSGANNTPEDILFFQKHSCFPFVYFQQVSPI